jgi:5-methyltetrahydropteroyltriglutamate--homocysteine methyltransferase
MIARAQPGERRMTGSKPPFKADIVGSLLRPPAIHDARARRKAGDLSAEALWALESACVRDAVALQCDVGLRVCTDGDYHRRHWFLDFMERIDGIAIRGSLPTQFHTESGDVEWAPPRIEVHGKLRRTRELAVGDFRALRPIAERYGLTPKQTLPSPSIAHFRGGRAAVSGAAYPDIDEFFADLAAVYRAEIAALYDAGCRYLQIDEVNLAFLCDPKIRAQVAAIGEDPDALPATYARLLNDTLRGKPADLVVCLHLCRGNHMSAWVAEGGYDPVAELTFGAIAVDGYFVEYDSPRAGTFEPLRHLGPGKTAVLGLVTTKKPQLESKDELKRRIADAARYVPLERLALSPQCGFASTLEGNRITADDQKRKLALVVETAHEVWGSR